VDYPSYDLALRLGLIALEGTLPLKKTGATGIVAADSGPQSHALAKLWRIPVIDATPF